MGVMKMRMKDNHKANPAATALHGVGWDDALGIFEVSTRGTYLLSSYPHHYCCIT